MESVAAQPARYLEGNTWIVRLFSTQPLEVCVLGSGCGGHPDQSSEPERCSSPFDGQGQVLHLRVLLFDLLDEVHEDVLQLRNQPGLRQTEVLVQRGCLFIPGGQTVVFGEGRRPRSADECLA